MDEFLDHCHLCGHAMGSNAPACPNCFGQADPAARDLRRALDSETRRASAIARNRERQKGIRSIAVAGALIWFFLLIAVVFSSCATR
jgi:hypothetical protein